MMCKRIFPFTFVVSIILLEFFSHQAIAHKIWIQAEDYEKIKGNMAKGSDVGITDDEALGDFILPTSSCKPGDNPEWYVQYTVDIPEEGTWIFWGRFRHPDGGGNSFCLDKTGKGPNPGDPRLCNSVVQGKEWCWDNNSSPDENVPPGNGQDRIELQLKKGKFTFRVYAREAPGDIQNNPRMDIILLTDEPDYTPTVEDAEAGLKAEAVLYQSGKLATTWGSLKEAY